MTEFSSEVHHRRSLRLKNYDYSQPGAYFVTIATHKRDLLFGEIMDGSMSLNRYGWHVQECWEEIPEHFPDVQGDAFIVMPNHIHGILIFATVGARHALPLRRDFGKPPADSLHSAIGSFKSAATKGINLMRGTPAAPLWQRNYYEHVVRSETELNEIRGYIFCNLSRWALDPENVGK